MDAAPSMARRLGCCCSGDRDNRVETITVEAEGVAEGGEAGCGGGPERSDAPDKSSGPSPSQPVISLLPELDVEQQTAEQTERLTGDVPASEGQQALQAQPVGGQDPPKQESAELSRKRRSRLLGGSAATMMALGFLGFLPAYWVGAVEGKWYVDAIGRKNYPDVDVAEEKFGDYWHSGLIIHSITALCWLLLASFQIVTGATGQPGDRMKRWHRISGYIACATACVVCIQAMVLQMLKPLTTKYIAIALIDFMILMNLVVGIRLARRKEYAQHKAAMAWTIGWSSAPGIVRLVVYIYRLISGGCALDRLSFYTWGMSVVFFALLGRAAILLKDTKTKLFWLNVTGLVVAMIGELNTASKIISAGLWCSE